MCEEIYQKGLPGKECPRCGNADIYEDFIIMQCSECGNAYMSYLAKDTIIK